MGWTPEQRRIVKASDEGWPWAKRDWATPAWRFFDWATTRRFDLFDLLIVTLLVMGFALDGLMGLSLVAVAIGCFFALWHFIILPRDEKRARRSGLR